MSYTNLLYHIVYATKERATLIANTLRPRLHEYLGGTVRGLGGVALEVNGVADHVHILAKPRPTISVSEFLSKLKSGSSGWAKRQTAGRLGWYARFAAFIVSESQVELVRRYIRNQEEHHRTKSFEKNLRLCCKHTTLISMQLIYGDDSVASFAGSVVFYVAPGSARPRQGLHSVAC
ncbi:MAG: REP-associated tyrosine transposase [Blastocatellia bacterium]|jgi:REP element-mobilizing transposase RayT|nr:REP-associated tyrosine transposase [Blastocatellia bacterium]